MERTPLWPPHRGAHCCTLDQGSRGHHKQRVFHTVNCNKHVNRHTNKEKKVSLMNYIAHLVNKQSVTRVWCLCKCDMCDMCDVG